MYYSEKTVVFYDGKFVKAKQVSCSPFAQTMHYGYGIFEGLRSYQTSNGVSIFNAKAHFERMKYAAHKLSIPLLYSVQDLENIAYDLLDQNNFKDAYIRPLLFCPDNMRLSSRRESILFMGAWKWPRYHGNNLLSACISSIERPNPKSCPVDAKISGLYVSSIMATNEAHLKGYDEAIMLDQFGNVAQASGANVFYEKEGELFTPPKGHILAGITRKVIMDLAREKEIKVTEKPISPKELQQADMVMLTGTAVEVALVGAIDGISFKKNPKHTKCAELAEAYSDLVHSAYEPAYTII
ncbi:aminotransferase class IV [Thermoflexibacter ruber]|uniref:branched-chain-amino-acid transaminase n=1 Tax=Thermoflexibacter ruber TaxID=1003 RepID=A0A1I2GBF8_9BACT|nr:aminotransferase class IV [Thermoflexibacter ruber]SFF14001.1 branched-chain amino acid aminotransferase [Thermoflexibacter ruber]